VAWKEPAVTTTAGDTHTGGPAGQEATRHVLLRDDQARLTLRRLRPWHRLLARAAAARLDRQLAAGTPPETSASLAARAIALTSTKARRDLAASVHRILAAAGHQPAARPARLPLNRAQITQSAVPLTTLAACLAAPGPAPAQGVAIISQLLADGTGPLYRQAPGDDLSAIIATATRALSQ
jgi:hypothetical protein